MSDDAARAFHTILSPVLDPAQETELPPLFWKYHGDMRSAQRVARYVQEWKDNLQLARFDPRGKVVLDAGSGFGLTCLLMRHLGASEVHGIELIEPKVEASQQIAARVPELDNVHLRVASVKETGFEPDTFDFVISNEAISHFQEIGTFLEETWRILKPGGILFVSDCNNGANPQSARETYPIWDRFENGPGGPVPGGEHVVEMPYRERRAAMVRETCPGLSDEEVEAIAAGTYRHVGDDVREAARAYEQTGTLPSSHYQRTVPPLCPASGQHIERLIYPKDLAQRMREAGFEVSVHAYLGGAGGNPLIRAANSISIALGSLTWPIGRALKAVGRKTAR